MPPRFGLLDYLQLHTNDVPGTAAFYRDVLDAAIIEEAYPQWARLRLANIDVRLLQGTPAPAGSAEPAFRVANIAAFRAHLEDNHVEITEDYDSITGGVMLGFRDPAGNRITIIQYGIDLESLRPAP